MPIGRLTIDSVDPIASGDDVEMRFSWALLDGVQDTARTQDFVENKIDRHSGISIR